MKRCLQEKLIKRFKFLRPAKDMDRHAYNLFGIECGDGWFKLLWELCARIEDEMKREPSKEFMVAQIKEKFAGLRFYVYGVNDKIRELIDGAENKSLKICEECGKKGKIVKIRGWFITLCKAHAGKRKEAKE